MTSGTSENLRAALSQLTRVQVNALLTIILLLRRKIKEGKAPYITASELAQALGRSETRARNLLNELRRVGLVKSQNPIPLIFGKELDSRQLMWRTTFDPMSDEVIKIILEQYKGQIDEDQIYAYLQNPEKANLPGEEGKEE